MRLRVCNIAGKIFLNLSRHFVKQSAGVKTLTHEQNKQTVHPFLNIQNRQNEKS